MAFAIGHRVRLSRMFTQEDYNAFAALTGDDNPIHVDPEFAKKTRFGRTLCHGMLLFSSLQGALSTVFPGTVLLEQELVFPGPTYTDEEMTIELEIAKVFDDGTRAEISVKVTRPDGSASLLGRSLVTLPPLGGLS
jgi:3-hydroxybutyryl-CoA dehydratase